MFPRTGVCTRLLGMIASQRPTVRGVSDVLTNAKHRSSTTIRSIGALDHQQIGSMRSGWALMQAVRRTSLS